MSLSFSEAYLIACGSDGNLLPVYSSLILADQMFQSRLGVAELEEHVLNIPHHT